MYIGSIGSSNPWSSVSGIQDIDANQSSSQSSAASFFGSDGDQANISPMGKLMSTLSKLQSSDQDQFKKVAQQVSDDLAAQAKNSTDPMQSKMLSQMSSDFAKAAETGTMDSLKPKGPPPDGKGGAGGSSDAESVIASDLSAATGQSYSASSSAVSSNAGSTQTMDELMKILTNMQQQDASLFKQTAQKIADDLTAKAETESDPGEKEAMERLAGDFTTAAQTGSTDSLKPKGGHGHRHLHGGAQSAASSGSGTQTSSDPMSILSSILQSDLSGVTGSASATTTSAAA